MSGVPTGAADGKLVLYLNDFWTNAAVSKAAIEVTVGDTTTKAAENQGLYELDAPWVKSPGRHDLTIAVTAGEKTDLLVGSLRIPAAPAPADQHNSLWDHIAPNAAQFPPDPNVAPGERRVAWFTLLLAVLAFTSSGGHAALGIGAGQHSWHEQRRSGGGDAGGIW